MTIVVAGVFDGVPTLISDLLISGLERPDKQVDLPTIGEVSNVFPMGSGFVPVSLSQKAVIPSPNVVIGWSGSEIHARTIIRELREKFAGDGQRFETVISVLKQLIREHRAENEIGFVGFVWEQTGFRLISINAMAVHAGNVDAYLLGSGAEDLGRIISSGLEITRIRGSSTRRGRAMTHALSLTGTLLSLELADVTFLSKYYGGAYEIAQFDGSSFTKDVHVTRSFFGCTKWSPNKSAEVALLKIIKSWYIGEWLCLGVLSPSKRVPNTYSPTVYLVQPFGTNCSVPEFPPIQSIQWNSLFHCTYAIHPARSVLSSISYAPNLEQSPIMFSNTIDGIEIAIKQEFIERLAEQLLSSHPR